MSTTFIHWARSQIMKRMSAAKRLNTERSFRVVVRLCARENTHSHTGLTHIYKNNVYKGLHNFYWSLHGYFISLYYFAPLFLSWFLQTSWSYLPKLFNSSVNRPEHSVSLDEPRASIKVTHLNRVVVDTGRVSVDSNEIKDVT